MARYRGPKSKIARRFREPIFGRDKALEKKNYGPGQHGNSRRRPKLSEYAVQLAEKQKAKYTYGLLEKQFRNLFKKAAAKKGITGENLLKFLEARLDNTVFRLGIAPTRRGDVVSVRERSKSLEIIADAAGSVRKRFNWLEWDGGELSGKFISYPERSEIPENIKEQLIVELYSK
ncbi:MAG: 30S ribosomal protein S4 [Bacteroidetes bacterium]|nr:30S ribosomal protein S4 [Bacteroidota bacterium]